MEKTNEDMDMMDMSVVVEMRRAFDCYLHGCYPQLWHKDILDEFPDVQVTKATTEVAFDQDALEQVQNAVNGIREFLDYLPEGDMKDVFATILYINGIDLDKHTFNIPSAEAIFVMLPEVKKMMDHHKLLFEVRETINLSFTDDNYEKIGTGEVEIEEKDGMEIVNDYDYYPEGASGYQRQVTWIFNIY